MEAAVVKRKPRMRAAVRGAVNRFQLVDKMQTDEMKGAARLLRLSAISRVHLASVRRSARGIKFKRANHKWVFKLKLGLGTPKIVQSVGRTEMSALIRLLAVPVHLKIGYPWSDYKSIDWKALEQMGKYVNALHVYKYFDSPEFSAFISSVTPHLNVLHSTWPVLARVPPLDLEKVRLFLAYRDFNELNRHKIRRLDVFACELDDYSGIQINQVLSQSIKTLGILRVSNYSDFPYDSIEAFCRRFPLLEELHIGCEYWNGVRDLNAYFTALWAKCFEIRDRLHVAGLKRLFLTVKHRCHFDGTETDWFEKLKQVEPFEKATSTIDRSKQCIRMFLKHNEPRGQKPTFICIKGDFSWTT
ncbi:hypothetical protein M3Y99_01977700 [Aphelenchoides fujianensis]|nr:hypothetical protein M3Y99_01977700 [Aphelenchoides fujianensis]